MASHSIIAFGCFGKASKLAPCDVLTSEWDYSPTRRDKGQRKRKGGMLRPKRQHSVKQKGSLATFEQNHQRKDAHGRHHVQQLSTSEQQLSTSKQQLSTSKQQLSTSEHQLLFSKQQQNTILKTLCELNCNTRVGCNEIEHSIDV